MEYMHKIKKMLCKELEEYGEKKSLSSADVEMIHKLTDTVKNLDKIEMLEDGDGYSERGGGRRYYMGGSSYDDEMRYSERRGRGPNARRDSMGRYSSDGVRHEDGASYYGTGYSRNDAKDAMMSRLGEMMEDADPNEREILKDCMRKIEKA